MKSGGFGGRTDAARKDVALELGQCCRDGGAHRWRRPRGVDSASVGSDWRRWPGGQGYGGSGGNRAFGEGPMDSAAAPAVISMFPREHLPGCFGNTSSYLA